MASSSSALASTSKATMSTRGIMISWAVISENSMTDLMSSLSDSVITPSSWMDSTTITSSSSVMAGSISAGVHRRDRASTPFVTSQTTGLNRPTKNFSGPL